uniref:Uncharacterized protein n=1 Tax=Anguilla anguilla TaxID=7936 RepID=A0A0E9S4H1_ANGAN
MKPTALPERGPWKRGEGHLNPAVSL